ncbi:MAG: hypothetical protein GEU86_18860 [Actinophytocola sp.]|nr:hypothetical protein [Actinophytocola sp.]
MRDHWAFTSAQARAAGYSAARIQRLLRRGEWVPLRRGVYVEASTMAAVAGNDERSHALAVAGSRRWPRVPYRHPMAPWCRLEATQIGR